MFARSSTWASLNEFFGAASLQAVDGGNQFQIFSSSSPVVLTYGLFFKFVLKSTEPVIQLLPKHLLLVCYQESTVDEKSVHVPGQYTNTEIIIAQK